MAFIQRLGCCWQTEGFEMNSQSCSGGQVIAIYGQWCPWLVYIPSSLLGLVALCGFPLECGSAPSPSMAMAQAAQAITINTLFVCLAVWSTTHHLSCSVSRFLPSPTQASYSSSLRTSGVCPITQCPSAAHQLPLRLHHFQRKRHLLELLSSSIHTHTFTHTHTHTHTRTHIGTIPPQDSLQLPIPLRTSASHSRQGTNLR